MTYYIAMHLTCDVCGAEFQAHEDDHRGCGAVAQDAGWEISMNKHRLCRCPDCVDAGKRLSIMKNIRFWIGA